MIVFHQDIRARLLQQFRTGHLSQSFLFVGPHGVGKFTLARWCAQVLMCASLKRGGPCNICVACRAVVAGVHPDVAVEPQDRDAATISIEEWRLLQDRLTRTPLHALRSVTIVPDCERLSLAAQHACLKTLEEPRPTSVLLLTATSTVTLLPTVLSRLSLVRVKPVPSVALRDALKDADAALPPQTLEELLNSARGIPGKVMRDGAVFPEAFDQRARMQRIAAVEGEPLWLVQQAVRATIHKENVYAPMVAMLTPIIRRHAGRAPSVASLQLCTALSHALTHTVNKDLALDAFGLALAQS